MGRYFNKTFFKFIFGFAVIISLSISLILLTSFFIEGGVNNGGAGHLE